MATRPPTGKSTGDLLAMRHGWCRVRLMTRQLGTERPTIMATPDLETVDELTTTVEKHLGEMAVGRDVAGMVRAALEEMSPVTVRTYLPVLVERRIRSQLG